MSCKWKEINCHYCNNKLQIEERQGAIHCDYCGRYTSRHGNEIDERNVIENNLTSTTPIADIINNTV